MKRSNIASYITAGLIAASLFSGCSSQFRGKTKTCSGKPTVVKLGNTVQNTTQGIAIGEPNPSTPVSNCDINSSESLPYPQEVADYLTQHQEEISINTVIVNGKVLVAVLVTLSIVYNIKKIL